MQIKLKKSEIYPTISLIINTIKLEYNNLSNNLLFQFKDNEMIISAKDVNKQLYKKFILQESYDDLNMYVDGFIMEKILQKIGNEDYCNIEIEQSMNIKSFDFNVNVAINKQAIPFIPFDFEDYKKIILKAHDFNDALTQLDMIVSHQDSSTFVTIVNDRISMIGLQEHTAAKVNFKAVKSDDLTMVMRGNTITDLKKFMNHVKNDDITIYLKKESMAIQSQSGILIMSLPTMGFMDYQNIIDESYNTNFFMVNTKQFKNAVDRVSIFVKDKLQLIGIKIDSKQDNILCLNSISNISEANYICEIANESKICFDLILNRKILNSICSKINSEDLIISHIEKYGVMIIRNTEQECDQSIIYILSTL